MIINKYDNALNEAMNILENSEYLNEDDCLTDPSNVPLFEHELGYIVNLTDIDKLCEDYGIDSLEALQSVAEANELDPEYIRVSIPEEEIYLDESIVEDYAGQVVINPISTGSLAYQYCDMLVDAFAESADEDYLYSLIEEEQAVEQTKNSKPGIVDRIKGYGSSALGALSNNNPYSAGKRIKDAINFDRKQMQDIDGLSTSTKIKTIGKNLWKNNKKDIGIVGGTAAGAVAGATAASVLAYKALKASKNKPKSWIAKKIAALRSVYSKWLARANKETNSNKAGAIKKICAKIMNVIDALMQKLQTAADR